MPHLPPRHLAAALLVLAAATLCAEEDPPPTLSLFFGTWVESNFVDIVPQTVGGDLETRDTNMVAAAVANDFVPRIVLGVDWLDCWLGPFEWELQGVKHFGYQDHWEATAAVVVRTQDLVLGDMLGVNIAVGEGLSYAFEPPAYEKGTEGVEGEDTRQLQNYLIYEAEWFVPGHRGLRLSTRIHHRSGAWGVISPQSTGSNFICVGLRCEL